jgi:hypothetical protein
LASQLFSLPSSYRAVGITHIDQLQNSILGTVACAKVSRVPAWGGTIQFKDDLLHLTDSSTGKINHLPLVVADVFDEERPGIPTKLHSRLGWAEKTVSDLVCQEYYAGRCYRNKGRHGRKPHPSEKWILVEMPAIITEEVWQAAKRRRTKNKVRSPRPTICSSNKSAEQNRLLADLRLIGDGDEVYRQARELIPMMKARINDDLAEKDKRDIIDSLVRRALLDGSGDLTIEFKVPRPEMSFGFSSS